MLEDKRARHGRQRAIGRQSGVAAVEFAMVVVVFFTLLFGVIELARAIYVLNTLQEVTRRAANAAANTRFSDDDAMDVVRREAIFRTTAGTLALADPISDEHIRIDYLSIRRGNEGSQTFEAIPEANLPASPEENRRRCLRDPNDAQCIRLVRARVCEPASEGCVAVPFHMLLPFVELPLVLHTAPTIVVAETLGLDPD